MSDTKTNITINVVEPGSSTPVVPNTSTIESISTPNTGLFTHGIGVKEVAVLSMAIFIILTIIVSLSLHYSKKHGKVTKLTKLFARYKQTLKTKKHATISLSILTLLVSIGTLAGLLRLGVNAEEADNTEDADTTSSLTVTAESEDLTIELGEEPVFAVLPVKVKVAEATQAGYTLKAYAEGTALASTTNPDNKIPMIIPEEGKAKLTDNTWGLSLTEPTSQEDNTYISFPETKEEALIIKSIDDYSETKANDETIIYYGFYLVPGLPYGTYTGLKINYDTEENKVATVTFDSNGLYFNDDEKQTINTTKYTVGITENTEKHSHTTNLNNAGEAVDPYPNNRYPVDSDETFVYEFPGADKVRINVIKTDNDGCPNDQNDYFTFWAGNYPNYTAKSYETTNPVLAFGNTTGKYVFGDYNNVQTDIDGDTVTFAYTTGPQDGSRGCHSGYGYYATLTGYDVDGNIIYLPGNRLVAGEYQAPGWGDLPYSFLGWDTDKDATSALYESVEDIEKNAPLTIGKTTTLYAIWRHATNITFDGNGADGGVGLPDRLVAAGQYTYLNNNNSDMNYQTAYTKTGYYFSGWNTKADGSGTAHANYAQFTAPTDKSENLTLYAQWQRYTTISFNSNGGDGNKPDVNLQAGASTRLCNDEQYYKTGYYVDSWNTAADGSGTAYDDCADFAAPAEPVDFTLYAQWKALPVISDLTYMQDFATLPANGKASVLGSMAQGQQYILKDSRDQKDYYISELADGNVWMTQNLDHDITSVENFYTSANTDLPSGTTWTGIDTRATSDIAWGNSETTPESYDPGNLYWDGTINTDFSGNLDNETVLSSSETPGGAHYHMGNYYNWTAAVAMRNSGSYRDEPGDGTEVNQSICPAGWRLPAKIGNKSYQNLVNMQNLTSGISGNIQNNPTYFVYGGIWYGSGNVGINGGYWSSVVKYRQTAYKLLFSFSGSEPFNALGNRDHGYSIRCVAR